MNLVLNEEQEELQATVRRFLADRSPLSRVREVMETPEGRDVALWERMAGDLGLQGLTVPEAYGGAGLGQVELSIVMEELGAALTPSPYLASAVLAATALLATDDVEARRDLLPGIAGGTTVATVAVAEDGRGWDTGETAARAKLEDGRWVLDGAKTLVPDGALADLVLVAARTGDELGLFAVEGGAPGLTRANLAGLDPTRRLARLELAGTPARRLVSEDAAGALRHTLDLAAVALAAEQLGGLQRCLDLSVAYAKARYQFGRAIGSFQAVKHLLADALARVDLARASVLVAALTLDDPGCGDPAEAVASAKVLADDAATANGRTGVQVHGGMGFTWEVLAHLYLKRAWLHETAYGTADEHALSLAEAL